MIMERGKIYLANPPANFDELLFYDMDKLFVFYDLDQAISPLLSKLPISIQKELAIKGKVVWRGWDMFYEPTKILCICKDGGENHKFYNLAQYFPDYDLKDELIAQRCVQELENALQIMGIWTDTLTSPASIYEKYYMRNLDIPTRNDLVDLPKELIEYAVNCADRELCETYQISHFDKIFEYDLSSAYASVAKNLLDYRDMDILQSSDYQPESVYGYCKCELDIDKRVKVSPIIYVAPDGTHSTATGLRKDYLSKAEIDFITKYRIGQVDIIDGWWLKPRKEVMPLEHVFDRQLEYKKSNVPLVATLAKEMVNGVIGKFGAEYWDSVGEFYNPFWFGEPTTQTRLEVGKFIYRNKCWDNLIQVRKDSVMVDRPLDDIPDRWRLAYEGEAIVISNDLTFLENRHPKHWTLAEVKEMFTEHPNTSYYEKKLDTLVTLEDAHKRKAWKELGLGKQAISSIDFYRLKTDRRFDDLPQTGGDIMNHVYKSEPLEV